MPNYLQRKTGHDYTAPSAYLITVVTERRARLLGTLVGASASEAAIEATILGRQVIAAFYDIEKKVKEKTGCDVQVVQYQLMPDHFHGILYVKDELPKDWHLGRIISGWKGACSRAYTRDVEESELTLLQGDVLKGGVVKGDVVKGGVLKGGVLKGGVVRGDVLKGGVVRGDVLKADVAKGDVLTLFEKGYNDRPLVSKGQLQGWIQYLRDNPRRLWLKRYLPDMLRKVYEFEAGLKGRRFTAVGNTFFVTYPEIAQVRCHRNLSEEDIQREVAHYVGLARKGVILVSPFISPAEKAVYEACYKEKLRMIRIVSRALDGKFVYPTGRDFDGCVAGFLLVLAPYISGDEHTATKRISRSQCLDMNDIAAELVRPLGEV